MKNLTLDDAGDIETPDSGCVIQCFFIFSSGREVIVKSHKTATAAHLIEKLLDMKSKDIEEMLIHLL